MNLREQLLCKRWLRANIALQPRSLRQVWQASSHMQAVVWVKFDFCMLQQTHSGAATWCIQHVCTWAAWMMILALIFCLGMANPCRVSCINAALFRKSMLVSNDCSIRAQSHFNNLNLRWSTMAKGRLLVRPLAFLNKLLRKPTQSEKKRWLPHKPCYWGKNVRRRFGEMLVQLECIIPIPYVCIRSTWFDTFSYAFQYVHPYAYV